MKSRLQEKLTSLILEELSERIKEREKIRDLLADFSDFPAEKVTEEFLNAFQKLLDSGLREEILNNLRGISKPQEAEKVETVSEEPPPELKTIEEEEVPQDETIKVEKIVEAVGEEVKEEIYQEPIQEEVIEEIQDIPVSVASDEKKEQAIISEEERPLDVEKVEEDTEKLIKDIVELEEVDERPSIYFRKEKRTEIQILPSDWIYLYGFSYAPNSEGKGFPSVELDINGLGKSSIIFGIDYGDVRIYISKINIDKYVTVRTGEPYLKPQEAINLKLEHSRILNELRVNEILVPLEFWTVRLGRENIVRVIEDRYINFLHALIDVHDAIDWDVDISVLDNYIMKIIEKDIRSRQVDIRRESRHQKSDKIDIKQFERVLFKEKEIANNINLKLTRIANKIKVDHIISLESSFLDNWKPILSARYVIGKEKRKAFHQLILEIQEEYKNYNVMINITSPKISFKF